MHRQEGTDDAILGGIRIKVRQEARISHGEDFREDDITIMRSHVVTSG
jgi:hypothetical protein